MKSSMEFISSFDGLKLRLRRDLVEEPRGVVVIGHGRGAQIETAQYRVSGAVRRYRYP